VTINLTRAEVEAVVEHLRSNPLIRDGHGALSLTAQDVVSAIAKLEAALTGRT
jgi:hypothetical protein